MPCPRFRLAVGVATLVFVAGCSSSDSTSTAGASGVSTANATSRACAEVSSVQSADPLDLARQVIDAAQIWDVTTLCTLAGRAEIPGGLERYHQAIADGLSTAIELVARNTDTDTNSELFRFAVPDAAGSTILGLGFQRQSAGWVLVIAAFVPG